MAEPVAVLALAMEAIVGWPAWLYRRIGHPVGGAARLIHACERRWNDHRRSEAVRRALVVVTVAIVTAAAAGTAGAIAWAAHRYLGEHAWIAVALCAVPGLAQPCQRGRRHGLQRLRVQAAQDVIGGQGAVHGWVSR